MTTTISLADAEALVGVTAKKWEYNGQVRHYFNVPGAAYKAYWTNDGKVHFGLTRGRSTTEASDAAERLLGCNVTERYSRTNGPASYVVVEA